MHRPFAPSRNRVAAVCVAALATVLALPAALAAAPASTAVSHVHAADRKITLLLDWVPNPDHVGLYWAQENGLFARRGLTVSLKAPSDPSAPIRLVGVGKADLAVSYEPELFFAAAKRLPVVAVAAIVPRSLNSLLALPTSGIKGPADLKGRTVGLSGIPTDAAVFRTMVTDAGLKPSDVKTITVGFSVLPALLSKKVDAIVAYRNVEGVQLAQEIKATPVVVPADQAGVPAYSETVLVANAKRLAADPAYAGRVRDTVAALVEATLAAQARPTAAVALMGKVTEYDEAFLAVSVPQTLRLMKPGAGIAFGCVSVAAWQRYGDWMRKTGLLAAEPDAAKVVTARYLPKRC